MPVDRGAGAAIEIERRWRAAHRIELVVDARRCIGRENHSDRGRTAGRDIRYTEAEHTERELHAAVAGGRGSHRPDLVQWEPGGVQRDEITCRCRSNRRHVRLGVVRNAVLVSVAIVRCQRLYSALYAVSIAVAVICDRERPGGLRDANILTGRR